MQPQRLLCSTLLILCLSTASAVADPAPTAVPRTFWIPGIDCGGPSVNGRVWDFEVFGGELVVAGEFTAAGLVPAARIARWDGDSWSPMGSGMNNVVYTLAHYDGKLVAGGLFTEAGGVNASRIAQWDGTSWQPLGTGVDGPVRALTVFESDLIVGGDFADAGGLAALQVARWNGNAWGRVGIGFGAGDPPGFGVRALAVHGGTLVAGGFFKAADLRPVKNMAYWNGTTWLQLGDWRYPAVYALLSAPEGLVTANVYFPSTEDDWSELVVRWNGSGWQGLGSGVMSINVAGGPRALATFNEALVVSGRFNRAGGVPASNIATWDGTGWEALGGGTNEGSLIAALAEFDGKLIAGGDFTFVEGRNLPYLASWDGTAWDCFGVKPTPTVRLAIPDTITVGQPFSAKVLAGTKDRPISDLFGFTGKLRIGDTSRLEALEVACTDEQGAPLDLGDDVVCFGHIDAATGEVAFGVTRKAGSGGSSGALEVARLVLRFASDEEPGCVQLELAEINAIDATGRAIAVDVVRAWEVCVGTNCIVWPGDTNNDGIVDERDVLPLGAYWGVVGNERESAGCAWGGEFARCWTPKPATYADAFGDGVVDVEDILCIGLNWGQTHAVTGATFALPREGLEPERVEAYRMMLSYVRGQSADEGTLAVQRTLEALIDASQAPQRDFLHQNVPNPLNPATTIHFDLVRSGPVLLRVFDVAGRRVTTLVNRHMDAGRHRVVWRGVDDGGHFVSSGVYVYRLQLNGSTATRKMVVAR